MEAELITAAPAASTARHGSPDSRDSGGEGGGEVRAAAALHGAQDGVQRNALKWIKRDSEEYFFLRRGAATTTTTR